MAEHTFTFPVPIVFLFIAVVGGIAHLLGTRAAKQRQETVEGAHERQWPRLLIAACAIYVAVFSVLSLIRYEHLLCGLYDLGIFDSVVRNLTCGRFLVDFRGVYDHVSPILVVCVPFYWVWDDPRVLLVIQSVVVGGAAVPLYLFVRTLTRDPRPAIVMAAAYLLHPLVSRVNLYDFHGAAFHPLAFFFTCFFFARGKRRALFVSALVSLAVKEDAVALVFGLGLFALADRKRRRDGLVLIGMAILWAVLAMKVYYPVLCGKEFQHYSRYPQVLGPTVWATARNAALAFWMPFTRPHVWKTVVLLLLPIGFLSVVRPWAFFALVCPPLAITFFASYIGQQTLRGHYSAAVLTAAFAAAAYGCRRFRGPGTASGVLVCAGLCNFFFGEPALKRYYEFASRPYHPSKHLTLLSIPRRLPSPVLRWHANVADALSRVVPAQYSVMAQNSLGHLFTRQERLLELDAKREADFYILDRASWRSHTSPGVRQSLLERLADSTLHERLLYTGGFQCFCRHGLAKAIIAEARRSWERQPDSDELNYLLGAMCLTQGDLDAAKMHLAHLVERDRVAAASVDILWMLADVHLRTGRTQVAIETFEKGLAISPKCAAAHDAVAGLYREQGRLERAQVHESRATELRCADGQGAE